MPGIFGFFKKRGGDQETNRELIEGMKSRLSHNPDYVSEIYADDWCGLGNTDLPWLNERKLYVNPSAGKAAAFSGFIYGWNDIDPQLSGESQPRVQRLQAVYDRYGDDLPRRIDGSFNAVVTDLRNREAIICNDKFGHRQLYYYEDDEIFMFSTEFKAFFAREKFSRRLDMRAVSNYFNHGYLLGDRTFLENVRRIRGGQIIRFKDRRTETTHYWDYDFEEERTETIPELIEYVHHTYRGIIEKMISGAEDIIVPLSGGLDSRFIMAHLADMGLQPHIFTHGINNCLDHRIAAKVARTLNMENYRFIEINPLWLLEYNEKFMNLTEGMIESSAAILLGISAQYGLSSLTSAFLNGIFGGPITLGKSYFKLSDMSPDPTYEDRIERMKTAVGSESRDEVYYGLFAPEYAEIFRHNFVPDLEEEFANCVSGSEHFHLQKDTFFFKHYFLRYPDQVDCNRFIWHDHLVLVDDRLADFHMRLPARLKLSNDFYMEYFRRKYPALAAIPCQSTGVNLYRKPSALKTGLKKRIRKLKYYAERLSRGRLKFYNMDNFHHYNQWYRAHKKIAAFYEEILLDDATINRGYFNKDSVSRLLQRQRRGGNSFYEISNLASFELFNRMFIDL
jgi:asparagine synthetase B (glutamine-hydrolysing)